jgi:hypothetical protein
MWRQAGLPITGGLLCLLAATPVNAAHPASFAPPAGPPLAPRTHGFMLYLSQPMGGGSGGATLQPKFGFRLDQVRMTGNSGAPEAGDPVQRRALIGWQFNGPSGERASDMRLELGGRVTYDMTHGGIQLQSSRPGASPSRSIAVAAATSHPTTASSESKSFELRGLQFRNPDSHAPDDSARPFTRDLFHEASASSSVLHDVAAAAIATFKSSHNSPIQQRSRPSERPYSMQESR